MPNRLIDESSPYLQMHAHNPVDWHPWGTEVFERARAEKKLVIVSIGYAACHWCHVMEQESFTNPSIAEIMNRHFIPVKVDREERPDVDEIYMSAIQLIGGRGGWPLNAFALPDGRPLYAVTYLPASQWEELLIKLKDFYHKDELKVLEQANQIENAMQSSEFEPPEYLMENWPDSIFKEIFERWLPYMDLQKGGYLNAPKFPLPVSWEFFLHYYFISGDDRSLNAVNITLENIAKGGIFDQLGGGFSRYSVDTEWKIPHFEKMLYDNAQLVSLYSHAYLLTRDELYGKIIKKTLSFVQREFLSQQSAFYTSLDADSDAGGSQSEGVYYSWTEAEFDEGLGELSGILKDFFSVSKKGNWEDGKNVLHCRFSLDEFTSNHKISLPAWDEIYQLASEKLFNIRESRTKPALDDKVLTSWNALMIIGFVDAYLALEIGEFLEIALSNASFLKKNAFNTDGSLKRNLKPGRTNIPGFLDDYAYLANAWISLYTATYNKSWLDEALLIISKAIELFEEPSSGLFFYTPAGHEQFILRKKMIHDNVLPSPMAMMAKAMQITGIYFSNSDLISRSEKLSKAMLPGLVTGGPYMAGWSSLILNQSIGYKEVSIYGENENEWRDELHRHFLPNVLIIAAELNVYADRQELPSSSAGTFAVICMKKICGLPIHSLEELVSSLTPKYQ